MAIATGRKMSDAEWAGMEKSNQIIKDLNLQESGNNVDKINRAIQKYDTNQQNIIKKREKIQKDLQDTKGITLDENIILQLSRVELNNNYPRNYILKCCKNNVSKLIEEKKQILKDLEEMSNISQNDTVKKITDDSNKKIQKLDEQIQREVSSIIDNIINIRSPQEIKIKVKGAPELQQYIDRIAKIASLKEIEIDHWSYAKTSYRLKQILVETKNKILKDEFAKMLYKLYSENIDKESLLKQGLSEEEIQKYLMSQIQK